MSKGKRTEIAESVRVMCGQFDQKLTQEIATYTVTGLMWCKASAVRQIGRAHV